MIISGIYKITNTKNQKVYIGSAKDINCRWCQHKTSLLKGNHHSIKLQRSYNIHGDVFIYDIIEECDIDQLIIREQHYIDLFDSYKNGYNSVPMAHSNLGMKHSDETKEILRKSSMGNKNMLNKKHTKETKNKISEKLKGKPLSEETKVKMSKSGKGRIVTEETRIKIRLGNLGKKLSEEAKHKISLSKIGKKQSKETIENRVRKNTGQKRTLESRKKISDKLKGIKRPPLSEEHKLKIGEKHNKKIIQINEKGDIKEFNSIKNCASVLGINHRRISDVLCGKLSSYNKFKFKYVIWK